MNNGTSAMSLVEMGLPFRHRLHFNEILNDELR